jgi:hypothetical protein
VLFCQPFSLPLILLSYILLQVFLHVLFERKKDEKRPAQVEQATPVLCSCHFGERSVERCLSLVSAVPISGTKELASRTTNIVWRTRSDTFVLFPLLELTLPVAQHHAGFVLKVTLVCGYILSPCFRGTSDESNDVAEGVEP